MSTTPNSANSSFPSSPRVFVGSGPNSATGEKPPTSFITTLIHLIKGYVGTGIFAMGSAFRNSGIVFGPILLTLIGLMNLNGQHMLVEASLKIADEEEDEADVRPTFAETVHYTLEGSTAPFLRNNCKTLAHVTNVFVYCTEVGFCCVYFVFIGNHLLEVADDFGWVDSKYPPNQHLMLAIALPPMWASVFLGNLKMLMPLSLISNLLMWGGIIIIFYYTSLALPPLESRTFIKHSFPPYTLFFGTTLFAFEGVTFVLPLRNEMRNPKYFTAPLGILNIAMAFITVLMISVGFMSYWKYGDVVGGSVFLNLPHKDTLAIISRIMVMIAVLFTFTLHLYIVFELSYPIFYNKWGPFKYPRLMKSLFRSAPVLLCYFLANVIPFLESFITLVGSLSASCLALMIPPILDMVAFRDTMSVTRKIKDVLILAIGIIGAILGTFFSIWEICHLFKQYK